MLPLGELRLNSYLYSQQPVINRASQSHIDNDGVRALVDAICQRVSARPGVLAEALDLQYHQLQHRKFIRGCSTSKRLPAHAHVSARREAV